MSDEMQIGKVELPPQSVEEWAQKLASRKPTKRVAVQVLQDQHGNVRGALANDGSIWYRSTEGKWTRLPDLPQD